MTSSTESWLAVQLAPAEEAALAADMRERMGNVLALVDFLAEQAASNGLPSATRRELAEQIDRWLAQLSELLRREARR